MASQKTEFEFRDTAHWFGIRLVDTDEELHRVLNSSGVYGFVPDTIAYTDTWSYAESIKNGLGDARCAGHMYFIAGADYETIVHEAVHMALGIMSRHGEHSLPITTDVAPTIEEDFCSLVGFIADQVIAYLHFGSQADDAVSDLEPSDAKAKDIYEVKS